MNEKMRIEFLPAWMDDESTALFMAHIVAADERNWQYRIHPRSDIQEFAVIDVSTDKFIEISGRRIWTSTSFTEAEKYARELSTHGKEKPKEETSLSQKIQYITQGARRKEVVAQSSPFIRCDKCQKLHKKEYKCEKID